MVQPILFFILYIFIKIKYLNCEGNRPRSASIRQVSSCNKIFYKIDISSDPNNAHLVSNKIISAKVHKFGPKLVTFHINFKV